MKKSHYLLLMLGGIVAVYDMYGLLLDKLSNLEHWGLSALVVLLISIAVKPKLDFIIKSRDEENHPVKKSPLNREKSRALKRLSSQERKQLDRMMRQKIDNITKGEERK